MKLDMLYSTYEDRIYSLIEKLPLPNSSVNIIIVHQMNINSNYDYIIKQLLETRNDIKYYKSLTKGVTKSRNIALKNATGDIVLFCDDDVTYKKDIQEIIIEQYRKTPDIGFITFAYSNQLDMQNAAKKFHSSSFKHNLKTILRVGTIEVTVRREPIIKNNVCFPEDMGAGTTYFLCDEPVFLSKLLKNSINGIYKPLIIGYHPAESSGQTFSRKEAFASRYLCFTRIFGLFFGFGLYYLYLVKNLNKFKTINNFNDALFIMFKIKHNKKYKD
ncbi:glycosyltransferase family A protein [Providencia vermicola]|uniref:glycosyltransferase family A protein n=1 Tax=Providencia vermicola TaxID=333965 RepID=UPI001CECA0BE|nr:glycosyltransferase family A protein [Providencia vermicola]